jgi:choline dehydrogenase-like flavoprotein
VDLSAVARGLKTGRLQVMTDTRVLALETDAHGRVGGAVCRQGKRHTRIRGRIFVLAGGGLETPRLLLASTSTAAPHGLGNDSGNVGRYFMETVWATLTVRFDVRLNPYKGPPIDARVWDFCRPKAGAGRGGYVLGVSGSMGGYQGPVSYAERTAGFGLAHKQAMRKRFGTVLNLFGVAEHEPRAENTLSLSARKDADGVPLLKVHSTYSAADRKSLGEIIARLRQWAKACGAVETLELFSSYDRPVAAHVGGACRMGHDPATSVVDPHGQVHGVPNLFIADASVLPGQGAGDSPSLTIQALALRTADRIARLVGDRMR